jgi:integrase
MTHGMRLQPTIPLGTTVREGIQLWLAIQGMGKRARTVEGQRGFAKVIEKLWPDLDLAPLAATQKHCLDFMNAIQHFSPPRYNALVEIIRKIIPAASFLPRMRPVRKDRYLPSPEILDRLLARLDVAHRGYAALIVRLLVHTGLRINEARQLTWTDVKPDHIRLPPTITKNGLPRIIPFIEGVEPVLAGLRTVSTGEKVLPQLDCKRALQCACRDLGLPYLGHHAFRHLFATRCIAAGVDIPTVALWLGHQDRGALLMRTYCHLASEHSMKMAKQVKLSVAAPLSYPAAVKRVSFDDASAERRAA